MEPHDFISEDQSRRRKRSQSGSTSSDPFASHASLPLEACGTCETSPEIHRKSWVNLAYACVRAEPRSCVCQGLAEMCRNWVRIGSTKCPYWSQIGSTECPLGWGVGFWVKGLGSRFFEKKSFLIPDLTCTTFLDTLISAFLVGELDNNLYTPHLKSLP